MKNIKLFATAMLLSILGTSFVEARTLKVKNETNATIWVFLEANHKNSNGKKRYSKGTLEISSGSIGKFDYSTKKVGNRNLDKMIIYNYNPSEKAPTTGAIKTKLHSFFVHELGTGIGNYSFTDDGQNIAKIIEKTNAAGEMIGYKLKNKNTGQEAVEVQLPSSTVLLPKTTSTIKLSYYTDTEQSDSNIISIQGSSIVKATINNPIRIPQTAKSFKIISV